MLHAFARTASLSYSSYPWRTLYRSSQKPDGPFAGRLVCDSTYANSRFQLFLEMKEAPRLVENREHRPQRLGNPRYVLHLRLRRGGAE